MNKKKAAAEKLVIALYKATSMSDIKWRIKCLEQLDDDKAILTELIKDLSPIFTDILTTCAPPVESKPDDWRKKVKKLQDIYDVLKKLDRAASIEDPSSTSYMRKRLSDVLPTLLKIIQSKSPPVNHEVVGALREHIHLMQAVRARNYENSIKRGFDTESCRKFEWQEDQQKIDKVEKLLADAGTCRCDCERYRGLLKRCYGGFKLIEHKIYMSKTDHRETAKYYLNILKEFKPDAALGAEKEEK